MHRTLCDFLSDLFQNSVEAGASRISLDLTEDQRSLTMNLVDNGKGMTKEELSKATDPFYTDGVKHQSRKVGLGLPFVIQTVEMTGGEFEIESEKGRGTRVRARFNLEHLDTPPPGDWSVTLSQLMTLSGDFEAEIRHSRAGNAGEKSYVAKRSELREVLGDLEDLSSLVLLGDFFRSSESEIADIDGGIL